MANVERDRSGGDTGSVSTEYVLVAVFIAVAAAVAIALFGANVLNLFDKTRGEMSTWVP